MKLSIYDIISEIRDMKQNDVDVIYEIYNGIIDYNEETVELICKIINHFSIGDQEYLDKIKSHIDEVSKYKWDDRNHPVNLKKRKH